MWIFKAKYVLDMNWLQSQTSKDLIHKCLRFSNRLLFRQAKKNKVRLPGIDMRSCWTESDKVLVGGGSRRRKSGSYLWISGRFPSSISFRTVRSQRELVSLIRKSSWRRTKGRQGLSVCLNLLTNGVEGEGRQSRKIRCLTKIAGIESVPSSMSKAYSRSSRIAKSWLCQSESWQTWKGGEAASSAPLHKS